MSDKLTIIGNLGKEPEMRYTPQGKAVTKFSVAVSKDYKDENGQWVKQDPEWHNVVCWDGLAENANSLLSKGQRIIAVGHNVTREYNGKEYTNFEASEVSPTLSKKSGDEEPF